MTDAEQTGSAWEVLSTLCFYLVLLLAGLVTGRVLNHVRGSKGARKICPHGLPVLGHAVALGRQGTALIHACRQRYGPAFSLELVGQRMCFLFEPHLIELFFKAPEEQITFRPAVEQFTQRVFGLPSKEFFPRHFPILQDLRHMLTPNTLLSHAQQLAKHAEQQIDELFPAEDEQVELFGAVRKLVFRSAVPVLFGKRFAKGSHPGFIDELEEKFVTFESGFEMAASPIPHFLQPRFSTARAELRADFASAHQQGLFEGTPVGELLHKSGLRPELAPNLLLALLWASQANTVPATFWSLAMICLPDHKEYLQAIRDELWEGVSAAAKDSKKGTPEISSPDAPGSDLGSTPFSALLPTAFKLATNRRSWVARCTSEATRLRVQSIDVRFAANDLQLELRSGEKVDVPKGCILALCPYEIHHDDALFPPKADVFDPNRSPMNLGDGNAIMPTVAGIAFGGGAYRCPGRFFAEMEVALLVQLILARREVAFVPKSSSSPAGAGGSTSPDQEQAQQPVPNAEFSLSALARSLAVDLLGKERAFFGLGDGDASSILNSSSSSSSSSSVENSSVEHSSSATGGGGSSGGGDGDGGGGGGGGGVQQSGSGRNVQQPGGGSGGSADGGGEGSGGAERQARGGGGGNAVAVPAQKEHSGGGGAQRGGERGSGEGEAGGAVGGVSSQGSKSKGSSGDPHGLLPHPDHQRLVGVKVPAGPCFVQLSRLEDDYLVV